MDIEHTDAPKFTLKQWNAVAVWSWNTNIENCAICKQFLSEPCLMCAGMPNIDMKNCQPIWSQCDHPFHDHCIKKWLNNNKTCPLCARDWIAKPDN